MQAESSVSMAATQAERRQRVINAAMELGAEGGYEAVQMRDVAARAGVAMGTLYRYFKSKDHLLAAALVNWAEMLEDQLNRAPAKGSSPPERVSEVLGRATRTMVRRPQLVASVVSALASSDPAVVECQQQVSAVMERLIRQAIGEPEPPDLDAIARILGYVWHSTLVSWVNGSSDAGRVETELGTACRLLIPRRPVLAGPVLAD